MILERKSVIDAYFELGKQPHPDWFIASMQSDKTYNHYDDGNILLFINDEGLFELKYKEGWMIVKNTVGAVKAMSKQEFLSEMSELYGA